MTDNELLAFMGTDPTRWVAEFQATRGRRLAEDGVDIANDDATMVRWFANAIEAGSAAEFAAVIDEARQRYDSDDRSAAGDGGWSTHRGPAE